MFAFSLIRTPPPHRDRGKERVLPFVFALLLLPLLLLPLPLLSCFCTLQPRFYFSNSCRRCLQHGFLSTPRQLSTAAAAVVIRHDNRQALRTRTRSHDIMLQLFSYPGMRFVLLLIKIYCNYVFFTSSNAITCVCRRHCRCCFSFPPILIYLQCFLPLQRTPTSLILLFFNSPPTNLTPTEVFVLNTPTKLTPTEVFVLNTPTKLTPT